MPRAGPFGCGLAFAVAGAVGWWCGLHGSHDPGSAALGHLGLDAGVRGLHDLDGLGVRDVVKRGGCERGPEHLVPFPVSGVVVVALNQQGGHVFLQ